MPEATLNAIPIFHDLDEAALKALGAICVERTLDAGNYLYRHGVQRTEMFFVRSAENFSITGIKVGDFPNFVRALAMVKKAAARANCLLAP